MVMSASVVGMVVGSSKVTVMVMGRWSLSAVAGDDEDDDESAEDGVGGVDGGLRTSSTSCKSENKRKYKNLLMLQ